MAIQTSIVTFKGKLDNTVGQKSFGGYSLRKKVNPRNPRTIKQLTQRAKIKLIATFAGCLKGIINKTFKNSKRTSFSEFINKNFETCFAGSYPNFEIQYDAVKVSQGPIQLPGNPSASVDGGNISVSWTDNTVADIPECQSEDKVNVVVYNSAQEQTICALSGAKRSDNQTTVSIPAHWSGDNVEVWFCMSQPDTNRWGDSTYLGSLSV